MELNKKYIVAKDNKLINSKYDLSLNEQKIMLVMASLIQPSDQSFNRINLKASELSALLGITPEAMYKDLPKVTKNLLKKVIEIKDNSNLIQTHFVSTAIYNKGDGTITLKFSDEIRPFLLQLKELYASYKLENVLTLKSKYSIRFYEILKSHSFKSEYIMTIDELRELMCLTQKSYDRYNNIKNKIVNVAIEEINEKTDINVNYEEVKEGRKIISLKFYIYTKRNLKSSIVDIKLNKDEDDYKKLITKFKDKGFILNKDDAIRLTNKAKQHGKDIFTYIKLLNPKINNGVGFIMKALEEDYKIIEKIDNKLKFDNHTQRDYDFDKLEEALLYGLSEDSCDFLKNNNKK